MRQARFDSEFNFLLFLVSGHHGLIPKSQQVGSVGDEGRKRQTPIGVRSQSPVSTSIHRRHPPVEMVTGEGLVAHLSLLENQIDGHGNARV